MADFDKTLEVSIIVEQPNKHDKENVYSIVTHPNHTPLI